MGARHVGHYRLYSAIRWFAGHGLGHFHALTNLAVAGQYTLDKVAQPVGEALVMTAAGLAVAIPAVMAYNLMGRRLARMDAELEGLAYDLRALAPGLAERQD